MSPFRTQKAEMIITEKTTVTELHAELDKRDVADFDWQPRGGKDRTHTVRAVLNASRGPEGRVCTPYFTASTMHEACDALVKHIDHMLATQIVVRAPSGKLMGVYPRNALGERYAREMRKYVSRAAEATA